MSILYGSDSYFIGVVKFFDSFKGFGFIASNNCNMTAQRYDQEFYVNSSSFTEEKAKKEGCVVVFQIDKQRNGRKKAINVRCKTYSVDDTCLALTYYGDHECINSDNERIDIFDNARIPIGWVTEKVQQIIENDPERSPAKTTGHFEFFIRHYVKRDSLKDRYIFDRQFSSDQKETWLSLFSCFTDDEIMAVLKIYPTIVQYVDNISIIQKWLEQSVIDNSDLSNWPEIHRAVDSISQENIDLVKTQIESLIDKKIYEIFDQLAMHPDLCETDLDPSQDVSQGPVLGRCLDISKRDALCKLWVYFRLSSKKYEKEKADCIVSAKKNHLKKELSSFINKQFSSYGNGPKDFYTYLYNLSSEDFQSFRSEIENSISEMFERCIAEKDYLEVVNVISHLDIMGDDYLNPYKQRLLPLISELLQEQLRYYLNDPSPLHAVISDDFFRLSFIFEQEEKEKLKKQLIPIIKETQSVKVLSDLSSELDMWIPLNEALSIAKHIISQWNFEDIRSFVRNEYDLFDRNILFTNIIIARFTEIAGRIPLSQFLDGTSLEEGRQAYGMSTPEEINCAFLKRLKKLIRFGEHSTDWDNYINSRSVDDLAILFKNEVIESLPDNYVEVLINSISLDSINANEIRSYKKFSLKDETHAKILETTTVNLFPLIANRLISMEMTDDNITLAVLLTELMTANKPDYGEYYTDKRWDSNFSVQIQAFKKTNVLHPRLSVILWAVHFKTSTSSDSLKEVFPILPPHLQIQVVRHLFKSISEGKLHHTAETLYNLITNGEKTIYFPIEITFTYLKLREKESSQTLDNNLMLKLLEGREDSDEWIGIRCLMSECTGRRRAYDSLNDSAYSNKFFNGNISKQQDGRFKLYIPHKLVDEFGTLMKYNNAHFNRVIELIQITYNENEYQVIQEEDGVSYYFDGTYEIDLYAIAWNFNFKYNRLDHFLYFTNSQNINEIFCECRLSNKVDNELGLSFYWCGNKPCQRTPVRYHTNDEWQHYTLLDFMRILGIAPDYINKNGKVHKFGHYIILSAYLNSFSKFYKHLKCRKCRRLMKPLNISNYASRAVTEFSCTNENCSQKGVVVYLNHCFNKQKCNATIDSRDSKQCPNGQYICPECGACCSTENFRLRVSNLEKTGGYVSDWLKSFIMHKLGHWEKNEFYCYNCGKLMQKNSEGVYICPNCDTAYDHKK